MKVKRGDDGILNRPMDGDESLLDGHYLYIISPKGGLYMNSATRDTRVLTNKGINSSGLHHSSFRAGQPVLSAGSIDVQDGEITKINTGSGHYGVPIANLLMACLHLHRKGIMKNNCKIMNFSERQEINIQDLFVNPKYESLRLEYHQLLHAHDLPDDPDLPLGPTI